MNANSLPIAENRLNFLGMDATSLSEADPNTFNGRIDSFRRFDKVLSDDEMRLVFIQDSQTIRYSFDDDLSDSTSNQAHGALYTPGIKAAHMDGTLESVILLTAADPPLSGPYSGITVAGWIWWSGPADQSSSPQPLATCWGEDGEHLFTAFANSGKIVGVEGKDGLKAEVLVEWDKGTLVGTTSLVEEWNWLSIVWDGAAMTVSLANQFRSSTTLHSVKFRNQPQPNATIAGNIFGPALAATSMTCRAGQWNCAGSHVQNCGTHSTIKELGVWGRALTNYQLLGVYEGGADFFNDGLIASLINAPTPRPAEITDDASNCKVGRCLYVPNSKHLERAEDRYRSGYNEGVKVKCTLLWRSVLPASTSLHLSLASPSLPCLKCHPLPRDGEWALTCPRLSPMLLAHLDSLFLYRSRRSRWGDQELG